MISYSNENKWVGLLKAILKMIKWDSGWPIDLPELPVYMDWKIVCFSHRHAAVASVHLSAAISVKERDGLMRNTEPNIRGVCREIINIFFFFFWYLYHLREMTEFQPIPKDSSSFLWLIGGLKSVALVVESGVIRGAETSGLLHYSLWALLSLFC